MDAKIAVELVSARLIGEHSIPVKIRTRDRVTEEEVNELFLAIDFLISHYRYQDTVPKGLALAFLDIYAGFSVAEGFYSENEIKRYEDIGLALQEKAYDLLEGA